MDASSYCKKDCPEKIPVLLGEKISTGGADGDVYEVLGQPDRIIKFSIIFETQKDIHCQKYESVLPVFNYLLKNKDLAYVELFRHSKLGIFNRDVSEWDYKTAEYSLVPRSYLLHYSILKKCDKLSMDEEKIFNFIVKTFFRLSQVNLDEVHSKLQERNFYLDFDLDKVIEFYLNVQKSMIKYNDHDVSNIMKDSFGNFKLIDLDRCSLDDSNII